MKKLLLAALMAVQGFITYALVMDPGPAPKTVLAQALNETDIKSEMARERKQKQYDQAKKLVVSVITHHGCGTDYADVAARAAVDYGVPARIMGASMVVESTCNPKAINKVSGDYGLYQINHKFHPQYTIAELMNPVRNSQIAAGILRKLIREAGLVEGLHRYNGLGTVEHPTGLEYANHVMRIAGYAST